MNIKLIALDMDGTLLTSDGLVTAETMDALKGVAKKGIEVLPVTGRCYRSLPGQVFELAQEGIIRYAVTSNGAEIREMKTGDVLYDHYIESAIIKELKKFTFMGNKMSEVYANGLPHIEIKWFKKVELGVIDYRNREYVLKTRRTVDNLSHTLESYRDKIEKIAIYFGEEDCRQEIVDKVEALQCLYITSSGSNNVEIMAKNCNKARALNEICKRLGYSLSHVMAIGDGENDIEMLSIAGTAVAMDNAHEGVKKVANFITTGNDDNGVAKAMRLITVF